MNLNTSLSRRGHHFAASLVLLVLLMINGVMVTPRVMAQDNKDTIRVGVVIKGPEGITQTACVTLDEGATGIDALEATSSDVVAESSSMGMTVCQINGTGCAFPDESCFCQCEGGDRCAYWSYFHLSDDGNWQYSPVGAGSFTVEDGAVEGWWWRDSRTPESNPPEPIAFETICSNEATYPRTVTDGMGRDIILDHAPERIASVTLGSDEILFSLVNHNRILGMTYFAEDAEISNIAGQLDDIPHTDLSGNPEHLISLNPDLVILALYSNPAALDQLLDAGVPVFTLADFNTVEDIQNNIRLLGEITGEEIRAEEMIMEMNDRIAEVQAAVADEIPVRVLYYEPGGITYGPGSTVDEILTLAGGINVVAEAGLGPYPIVNAEFLLAVDPDVILLGGWFSGNKDPLATFESDEAFRTRKAVKNGRVYRVVDAHMTNVSHYIATGVEDVAQALYPSAFTDEMVDVSEARDKS